jgi:hypothetical protein
MKYTYEVFALVQLLVSLSKREVKPKTVDLGVGGRVGVKAPAFSHFAAFGMQCTR